jgi:spermidine/putrescine-binding protein
MCIPATSKNKEIAERYIDFMLMEEAAVANALYTYYASPNAAVRNSEEYMEGMAEIKEDAYDKMYDTTVKATYYENLTEDKLALINRLWEELKSDMAVSTPIYVICGTIVAVIVGFVIFFAVRRKKRAIY